MSDWIYGLFTGYVLGVASLVAYAKFFPGTAILRILGL